jgi:hypothetical protein
VHEHRFCLKNCSTNVDDIAVKVYTKRRWIIFISAAVLAHQKLRFDTDAFIKGSCNWQDSFYDCSREFYNPL